MTMFRNVCNCCIMAVAATTLMQLKAYIATSGAFAIRACSMLKNSSESL